MTKYGTDERGWPLAPVDPAAIPDGYEPASVGWAEVGEVASAAGRKAQLIAWKHDRQYDPPRLIVRPIKQPIELPLSVVPFGWWVAKDEAGWVHLHEKETRFSAGRLSWVSDGQLWPLPPWIAEQLPSEWHSLPWDQSAMQQTKGGEA